MESAGLGNGVIETEVIRVVFPRLCSEIAITSVYQLHLKHNAAFKTDALLNYLCAIGIYEMEISQLPKFLKHFCENYY